VGLKPRCLPTEGRLASRLFIWKFIDSNSTPKKTTWHRL